MMGTAYTHFIENGEITDWKDFLKLCTRAFGVFAEIREEPLSADIPIYFEVKQELHRCFGSYGSLLPPYYLQVLQQWDISEIDFWCIQKKFHPLLC